jgi:hypothetical protein
MMRRVTLSVLAGALLFAPVAAGTMDVTATLSGVLVDVP